MSALSCICPTLFALTERWAFLIWRLRFTSVGYFSPSHSSRAGCTGHPAKLLRKGGITFAQDAKSAKYDDMPRSAIAAGCVDFVLPPDRIAEELARICAHPYVTHSPSSKIAELVPDGDPYLRQLILLLRTANKVDFSDYKPATLKRRILRRMALHKIEKLKEYTHFLQHHPAEVEALYEDILIHVTSFFRDPDAFEALKTEVFPTF